MTTGDTVGRAVSVIDTLADAGVTAGLVGGLGVAVHRHGRSPASFDRSYSDVDIVVGAGSSARVVAALAGGYVANKRFNALHGERRMMFHRVDDGVALDVFVGRFAMCHALELSDRLDTSTATLTPADLFLTKMQVVEINDKDLVDLVALVHHHQVEIDPALDADVIDLDRIGAVCGTEWGWYATVVDNLVRVSARAADLLDAAAAAVVAARCAVVGAHLEAVPKSMRWRSRARVGRRVRWYELPEEVGGAGHG
jgi:hypothetical protein